MRLLNVGFKNMVAAHRVIAVISPDSAPVKRFVQEARDSGRLLDATAGRKTRAVITLDSGQVILSALQPETISTRMHSDMQEENAQ